MDQHSNPQSETLQGAGVLEFRVSRPGVAVRRLRLTGNRYTFGRDPAATVRLDDPTLQPVHALLLREVVGETERLVLRAISVPLQVNGKLTAESILHTGDHFQLGSFDFELIGSVGASAAEGDSMVRGDSKAKPPSPRLSFSAGMRLVDESGDAARTDCPLRTERTLDAIEQALASEGGRAEISQRAAALRQEIEQTLREESRRALERQHTELSQEHRREMETVLQRFADTQEQAASANRAIESMRQQVADLGKQLRIATESKWEQRQALEKAGQERDAAREELRQTAAKSQRLISELDAARRDRSEISSALHDMTIQLYTATAESDSGQSRARELARQREDALQKVDSFARRCEELTEQLRQAEHTCQTVSDQRDRFAEQLRQRTVERDTAVALADQRGDQLAAKESVIDTLRSQVSELEQAVAESRHEAEDLRTECQAACDSVAKLEEAVREGEQQRLTERASWEAEADELRASVEQISIELAAASGELARSNEATDVLNAELTATRDALAEAESEIAVRPSADELQAIRERLETTEQQLRQLQIDSAAPAAAPDGAADTTDSYAGEPRESDTESSPAPYAADPDASLAADTSDPDADLSQVASEGDSEASTTDGASEPNAGFSQESAGSDVEASLEAESNASPWAAGLGNPWNIDSSDHDAPDQDDPLPFEADPAQAGGSVSDVQTAATDEMAAETFSPWQSTEQSEMPNWEEPTAGSLASNLLKQLEEVDRPEETATAAEFTDAGFDDPTQASTGEIWHTHDGLTSDLDSEEHTALSGHDDDERPTVQGIIGTEDEPAMADGEIEQVREFLRSDIAPDEDGVSIEDEERYPADPDEEAAASFGDFETSADVEAAAVGGVPAEAAEAAVDDRYDEVSEAPASENEPVAAEQDDDDSIEAYMNRLLQRVQGGSSNSYSPPTATSTRDSDEGKRNDPQQGSAAKEPAPEPPIDADAPFVPRSQAPERSKNLAAMRELANSSARTAIMSSVRKQAQSTALQKFGQAAGCAVGATAMLYFSQMQLGWQMLAAICMTVLAVYWVVEALQLQAQLRTEPRSVAGDTSEAESTADVESVIDADTASDGKSAADGADDTEAEPT